MRTPREDDVRNEELDPVELLVAECFASDARDRSSTLEELCARHPELAPALRSRLSALERIGLPVFAPGTAPDSIPAQLGEFRLIERIGGGGMGVVYRAEQTSLGREVALKLVRPEQLYFPSIRERFRREAEAVARLAHPAIVPIYAVGEAQGIPYFAMEHVAGANLSQVLRRLSRRAPESLRGEDLLEAVCALGDLPAPDVRAPLFAGSWVECVLRIVRSVAEALEHAHQRGVLHRDVKPSNVAVTPSGRAMLFDFGLTTSDRNERMTRTGAQIGTLAYMSPEQVQGEHEIDRRSDVYSLGVALYELLTLQLPYRGADALATQAQILDGRPDSIRARNREVHADVEIVCRVAMERDPARRYASAAAFARDLDNLLAKRPIEARPPGSLARAVRLARRRPAATASALAVLSLAIAAGTVFVYQKASHAAELVGLLDKERAARLDADLQRDSALRAREEADESRKQAVAAAQDSEATLGFLVALFNRAAPQGGGRPSMSAQELLEFGAREVDQRFADRPVARARAQVALAQALAGLGDTPHALPLCRAAVETFESRAAECDPHVLAVAWNALAEMLFASSQLDEAQRAAARAIEYAEATAEPPTLSAALVLSLNIDARGGRTAEAHAKIARVECLLASFEPPIDLLIPLGTAHYQLGDAGRCIEVLEHALNCADRDSTASEAELVAARSCLATALCTVGRIDEAEPMLQRAREEARATWGEDSEIEIAAMLALARIAVARKRADEARSLARDAVNAAERRAGRTSQAFLVAGAARAEILVRLKDWSAARELYETALLPAQQELLGSTHPLVARSYRALGLCEQGLGGLDAAMKWHQLELELAQQLGDTNGERLANDALGHTLEKQGALEKALEKAQRAYEIAEASADREDDRASLQRLALLCDQLGRKDEAAAYRARLAELAPGQ